MPSASPGHATTGAAGVSLRWPFFTIKKRVFTGLQPWVNIGKMQKHEEKSKRFCNSHTTRFSFHHLSPIDVWNGNMENLSFWPWTFVLTLQSVLVRPWTDPSSDLWSCKNLEMWLYPQLLLGGHLPIGFNGFTMVLYGFIGMIMGYWYANS